MTAETRLCLRWRTVCINDMMRLRDLRDLRRACVACAALKRMRRRHFEVLPVRQTEPYQNSRGFGLRETRNKASPRNIECWHFLWIKFRSDDDEQVWLSLDFCRLSDLFAD
jgi:hypothetical protein